MNSTEYAAARADRQIDHWISGSGQYKHNGETIRAYGKSKGGFLVAIRTDAGIFPAGVALDDQR